MSGNILVDSAAYIDLLRAGVNIRQRLIAHLRAGRLYNCGIVRAEVLRGIKSPVKRDDMEAFFDIIPEVPCDARLWSYVANLGWELGRRGKWPPVTDLAIATCALRVGADLVSPDAHFKGVPGLVLRSEIPE